MSTAPFEFATWFAALPLLVLAATITWLLSLPLRNATLVDSLWPLMLFAAGVVYALHADPRAPRLSLVLWLLALWALRLATFVTVRNAGQGEIPRYRAIRARHEPRFALKSLYLVFWLRAALAWIVSLPLLGAFASIMPLRALDYAGAGLCLAGFVVEVAADWQLARFRRDPANSGARLARGLWRHARHPNYLGDLGVWWGFWLIAVSAGAWWTLPGPLLLTFLLLVRAPARLGRNMPTTS